MSIKCLAKIRFFFVIFKFCVSFFSFFIFIWTLLDVALLHFIDG